MDTDLDVILGLLAYVRKTNEVDYTIVMNGESDIYLQQGQYVLAYGWEDIERILLATAGAGIWNKITTTDYKDVAHSNDLGQEFAKRWDVLMFNLGYGELIK